MVFQKKIITDQGRNFESELIDNLCQVAGVKKLCTSPYHPQTNGQCEHFNSTLLNMLGTLNPEQKKDWKNHVSAMAHAYNCTKNTATGFSPYYLLFEGNLDFQWMLNLDYRGETRTAPLVNPIMSPS